MGLLLFEALNQIRARRHNRTRGRLTGERACTGRPRRNGGAGRQAGSGRPRRGGTRRNGRTRNIGGVSRRSGARSDNVGRRLRTAGLRRRRHNGCTWSFGAAHGTLGQSDGTRRFGRQRLARSRWSGSGQRGACSLRRRRHGASRNRDVPIPGARSRSGVGQRRMQCSTAAQWRTKRPERRGTR